jgi:ubiquinone/menaquinone biosynthesis C-methylase UbiE
MIDPLHGSSWSAPGTVAGFAQSTPNATLLRFAGEERERGARRALDLGCGAGRNAVPLAGQGWNVIGLDLSAPMLLAAVERARAERPVGNVNLVMAPMEQLPFASTSVDLVIAHGIWNLARSAAQFRAAIREAARVARSGAGLFVFTFSRTTLPEGVTPVPGEPFVFTEFSGEPQCFLTSEQLIEELGKAGFIPDETVPLIEHNRPRPGALRTGGPPVIYEGAFRRTG